MKPWIGRMIAATLVALVATNAGAATPEQKCLKGRSKAKAKFESCVDGWLARLYGSYLYDDSAKYQKALGKLAKCRIKYDAAWVKMQAKLAGTTCDQARFADNGNGTITDNLSGLVWEKKSDDAGIHEKDYIPTWSTSSPWNGNGTAFTAFLTSDLNTPGFAGANDWRLPTVAELQTILLPQPHPCTISPCVPAIFDTGCMPGCTVTTCSCTYAGFHWSSTTRSDIPGAAWYVDFDDADVDSAGKISNLNVRAVRGGL